MFILSQKPKISKLRVCVSMQQTCQDINKPPALMLVQIKSSDHIDASNKPTCSGSQLIVSQN